MVLKKEIMKTQNKELEKAAEYRHLLVHAIHECAANFPDIAANVIHLLMDFLVRLCIPPPCLHAPKKSSVVPSVCLVVMGPLCLQACRQTNPC